MKFWNNIVPLTLSAVALALGPAVASAQNTNEARPNVLIIDCDDLGFGDVHVYGTRFGTASLIPTPRMDSLAGQGMLFDQMHSCTAICSQSRYGILTGRYAWRLAIDGISPGGIVGNYGQSIIRQGEMTIAQFLKNQGYDTAAFGKWHLGAQWYDRQGNPYIGNGQTITDPSKIDLVRPVEGQATDHGFNHFYGMAATINQPPYVTVVDNRIYFNGAPATNNSVFSTILTSQLADGPTGVGDTNNIDQVQYGPRMIAVVTNYLAACATNPQPFFAFVAMYSPHLPHVPTLDFVGSSGIPNFAYGDYVHEMDYWIGQVLDSLGANSNNTIVMVTSDNGPEGGGVTGGALAVGHDPNGPFRGVKRDSWEGGHREPCIIRWPGKVAPGSISSNLLWQGDLYATIADYLGATIPTNQAPDSQSFLYLLINKPAPPTSRDSIVTASIDDQLDLQMVDGWKLIDGTGSGGFASTWDADNNVIASAPGTPSSAYGVIGGSPKQLFYLPSDIGERVNLQATFQYKTNELMARLNIYRNTTSGNISPPDSNGDGVPDYWKVLYGLNPNQPNVATNHPPADSQLTYLQKYLYGLNPLTNDTDGDGLTDFDELFIYGTNPLLADTDGDGYNDGVEIAAFSNPRNPASIPPATTNLTVTQLAPSLVQLAGVNGTINDPAISSNSWSGSTSLFVRERSSAANDAANQYLRTRLFVKFDLSSLTNRFVSARMRVYQVDRLNDNVNSPVLEMGRVTASWSTNAGALPLFDSTPVVDFFNFGNTADFGTSKTSQGFYSGTPGVPGTNDLGFDPNGQVTDIVSNWLNGSAANYGLRLDIATRTASGAAFSPANIGDSSQNEQFALLVTTSNSITVLDSNTNGMLDSQELAYFGNLNRTGLSDFDGDGIPDRVELAMGSNPTNSASRPEFDLHFGSSGQLLLTFQRNLLAGIGYEIQTSPDLQHWTPDTGTFTFTSATNLNNGYERVVFSATPQNDTLFIRLNLKFP